MAGEGGFVIWFTGLSGAGKSTLARALEGELRRWGRLVEILDGDIVRTHLSKGLGFSKEDRDTNIRRIGFVSSLLGRNGVVAIAAAISPYASVRQEVREMCGGRFVEVYARASLPELQRRDVKGLYKKALAGEIAHFTGISDPYEPPDDPEITVDTDTQTPEESLALILAALERMGYLAPERAAGGAGAAGTGAARLAGAAG